MCDAGLCRSVFISNPPPPMLFGCNVDAINDGLQFPLCTRPITRAFPLPPSTPSAALRLIIIGCGQLNAMSGA